MLPGFGPDGYKTWDIQGLRARMASPQTTDVIEIDRLELRLFSGGDPLVLEATLESPSATVYPRTSQAKGDDFLYIKGPAYTVMGQAWDWDGKTQLIHVGRNVQVTFTGTANATTSGNVTVPAGQAVTIRSDRLEIHQETDRNHFLFAGNVTVTDNQGETDCRTLEVLAARASPKTTGAAPANASGVGQIQRILAHQDVVVREGGLEAWSQEAELVPADQRVVLSGEPLVRDKASDALLQGGKVTWWRDRQEVEVEPVADVAGAPARVRVSLPPLSTYQKEGNTTVSSAPVDQGPDAPRMLVSGEVLHAHLGAGERRIVVERSVHVDDPSLTLDADRLQATFDAAPAPAGAAPIGNLTTANNGAIGRLNDLLAQGGVVIRQPGRVTTTDQAEILPATGEVALTGNPRVEDTSNRAVITGNRILLLTDTQRALVTGSADHPAELTLPAFPVLGADASAPRTETHVVSDTLAMYRGPETSRFVFHGRVRVTAQDMQTTCATLEALTRNAPAATAGAANPTAGAGEVGEIVRLLAQDQVVIRERDYEARAASAEIFPRADVENDSGATDATTGTAHRFVQLHGDPEGLTGPVRPEVILPPLGNMGWETPSPADETVASSNQPTIITSDEQELFTGPGGNQYWFKGNVNIDGGDLHATCDEMQALTGAAATSGNSTTGPSNTTSPNPPAAGAPASVERIVAQGNVRIVQATRIATAGRAEILPGPGTVTLSEEPRVTDSAEGSSAEGAELVLRRGQRTAYIEGAPPGSSMPTERPTVILPPMNFDNIFKAGNNTTPAPAPSP